MHANLLKQKSSYFKNLSPEGQQRFISRLFKFMEEKSFIGREGLLVTDEIRVLIASSAVQLTFGLDNYTISHLHTINIFPHVFYSRLYETAFKGLTTQGGVLSLSWDDFRQGYANENDKINLGLHELAHALNIDWTEEIQDEHIVNYYDRWKEIAAIEIEYVRTGRRSFFRKYAGTNMHEFFAVCIEHFFEVPVEFHREMPALYGCTALLLNQDPENAAADYQVKPVMEYDLTGPELLPSPPGRAVMQMPVPSTLQDLSRLQVFLHEKGIYLAMTATFLGLFAGVPLLFWFSSVIMVDVGTLFILIFLCGSLGLLQWKFLKNYLDMYYHQFAMYAFSGFGLCLLNFLLFLNMSFSVSKHQETYDLSEVSINPKNMVVSVDRNESVPLAKNLTSFLRSHFSELPAASKLTVTYSTGLLGLDVISDCEFK